MNNTALMKALKAVNFISGSSVSPEKLKRHRAAMERAGKLAAPHGDIEVSELRVGLIDMEAIRPEYAHNPQYAIMYAHGGGYVCGGLSYARILAGKIATATGFTVYSFDYRLAPENPYPAALEDALSVWEDLSGRYQADHIFIAGESAGGNLALCVVQKLLEEGRSVPQGLILFSPWTDMTGTASSYETNSEIDPILTKEYVMNASKVYIGSNEDPKDARFSPLYGSFEGFPATFIFAGRNEILLDDSVSLLDRITESGAKAVLDIEDGGWHVYPQMPVPLAGRAMKRLSAYITKQIYGDNIWEVTTGTK